MITAIRKSISGHEDPPVTEILETSILSVIAQIFRFPDNIEENRIMKVYHLSWLNHFPLA